MGEKEINGLTEVQSREAQSKAGAKAIAKIHEKLQGYEDSTAGEQQGVEGQVQLLINSARDPDNLCLLYPGWEPWTWLVSSLTLLNAMGSEEEGDLEIS